jgi:dimethylamine monooxygenase subunit C
MSTLAVKSQPVYQELEWDRSGTHHILFVAAEDAALAHRLLANPPPGNLTLIRLNDSANPDSAWAKALAASARYLEAHALPEMLDLLREALYASRMGTRLYLVGPEDAIWQASQLADSFGMTRDEVRQMQLGTTARPVFCVHCRTTTRGVHTNIVPCSGCGRALFVRDHFSRRLGAYMGFQIDAESPGDIPAAEVIYP